MACPVTAGTVALLLEQNPQLGPKEVIDLIQNNAASNAYTGTLPNADFGYGILDAYQSMETLLTPVGDDISIADINYPKVYPNPSNSTTVTFDVNGNDIEQIDIYSAEGQFLQSHSIENNITKLDVSTLGTGVFFFHFKGKDNIQTGKLILK